MKTVIILAVIGLLGFVAYRSYRAYKEESAEARTLNSLPSTVRHVVAQMDAASQASFFNEYERKKRRRSLCYLLWFTCGAHYLYLRKNATQFVFWILILGIVSFFWWILDLFRMPGLVRTANEQVAREALQTLHVGAVFAQLSGQTATQLLTSPAPSVSVPPPPTAALAVPPVYPAPAGGAPQWSTDPSGRHELRYWDGAAWTAHVSNASVQGADPL